MQLDLPNLIEEPDRYGNPRLYVRVKVNGRQRRIRIKEAPGTREFLEEYRTALESLKAYGTGNAMPASIKGAPLGSLGWLAGEYLGSSTFKALATKSRTTRRRIVEDCLREPLKPGSKLIMRDCPYLRVNATHVIMLRDRKNGKPGAANNRLKYLSAMFGWAINEKRFKIGTNPCRDVNKIGYATDGFHTWTVEEVIQYLERHPVGTQANLAMCLMLFLGARRGDTCRLGPKNMRDGLMTYVPRKTAYKRVDPSVKPVLAPLAEAIRRTPIGLQTFLVTGFGKPFTDAGFGNKMREWCDEAGLPECSSHGLKKAAATVCATMGATDRQLMALFDWTSEKQANVYTAKANKKKLAADCARLLDQFFGGTQQVQTGAS
jgi:integrase